MGSEVISATSVNTDVYDRLREKITFGKIPPGKRITIRAIANSFGVSTMPVREALRRLQADGFVYFERRSVIVRELSLKEVEDIFVIRQRLETLAIEWSLPKITQQEIDELKDLLRKMDEDTISNMKWQQLNQEFHLLFYDCSESHSLNLLVKDIWDQVTPYMCIFTQSAPSFREAQLQHYAMVKLIEDKDLEGLLTLTVTHLKDTCDAIKRELVTISTN